MLLLSTVLEFPVPSLVQWRMGWVGFNTSPRHNHYVLSKFVLKHLGLLLHSLYTFYRWNTVYSALTWEKGPLISYFHKKKKSTKILIKHVRRNDHKAKPCFSAKISSLWYIHIFTKMTWKSEMFLFRLHFNLISVFSALGGHVYEVK